MTTMSVGKLGPSTAMMPMASRMKGKASWASATVMITVSVQPPLKPARSPSAEPMRPPTSTAAKPTMSDTREPKIMRESTSRPRWSVPSTCARPSAASRVGAASRARSDWRVGSWGASHGAAAATTTSSQHEGDTGGVSHGRRAGAGARPPRRADDRGLS